jgi:hypothetical protein
MKTVNVPVKSNKEDLGSVNVNEFETLEEAVVFFQKEAGEGAAEGAGAIEALKLLNAQYKAGVTNAYRVSKTRTASPITLLKAKLKTADKSMQEKFAAFLESVGLPSDLD